MSFVRASQMPKKKVVYWNLGLIVAVGLYGTVTNEPYWRDNGHDPWLYDYFYWFALALNGPSGFLADYFSWLTRTYAEERYLIQYTLWCLLIWPQWKLYDWFARWRLESVRKKMIFNLVCFVVIVAGAVVAYEAWLFGHRSSDFFIDKYFWFVRIAGLSCSGVVVFMYARFVVNQARSNHAFNTDAPKRRAG